MSTLTIPNHELPATPPETLKKLFSAQQALLHTEQVEINTEHVIHGGMYARTVTMPPGVVLMGALIKRPTLVIVVGTAHVYVGDKWERLAGYKVLPASANRKQIFVSVSPVVITMIFPTSAKTVEEAEAEFTDEAELLLSRRQDCNTVTVTGE